MSLKNKIKVNKIITLFKDRTYDVRVRFEGDLFADRSGCDWLTAELITKLDEARLSQTIIYSNHDHIMLHHYPFSKEKAMKEMIQGFHNEERNNQIFNVPIGPYQSLSLQVLLAMITARDDGDKIAQRMNTFIETIYSKLVKIVDLSIDKDPKNKYDLIVRLHEHALNGKSMINTFMRNMKITGNTFQGKIENLNTEFKQQLNQWLTRKDKRFQLNQSIVEFIWTRSIVENINDPLSYELNSLEFDGTSRAVRVVTIHGHDGKTNIDDAEDLYEDYQPININGHIGKALFDNCLKFNLETDRNVVHIKEHTRNMFYLSSQEQADRVYRRGAIGTQNIAQAVGSTAGDLPRSSLNQDRNFTLSLFGQAANAAADDHAEDGETSSNSATGRK